MTKLLFSRRWMWAALGLAIIAVLLFPVPPLPVRPTERTFRVEASSYEYSPAVLYVNPGDRVTLELASTDVVHGLYIDGYGLEAVADPGQTAQLSFVADRPGSFRIRCSVTCGALHPFMVGKLNVGPNWLFWKGASAALLAAFAGIWLLRK